MERTDRAIGTDAETGKRVLWVTLLLVATIGFSFVLACATPFAALATLAALNMPRRNLFALAGVA